MIECVSDARTMELFSKWRASLVSDQVIGLCTYSWNVKTIETVHERR